MNRADRREDRLETHEEDWAPPSHLPDPKPQDGWRFRWVRLATLGETDRINVSKRRRGGWEPVSPDEQPALAVLSDSPERVEIGGLMLCKASEETMRKRDAYYARMAQEQVSGLSGKFRESAGEDRRMPLIEQRQTTVSSKP